MLCVIRPLTSDRRRSELQGFVRPGPLAGAGRRDEMVGMNGTMPSRRGTLKTVFRVREGGSQATLPPLRRDSGIHKSDPSDDLIVRFERASHNPILREAALDRDQDATHLDSLD
jgi:hypothetical protein